MKAIRELREELNVHINKKTDDICKSLTKIVFKASRVGAGDGDQDWS